MLSLLYRAWIDRGVCVCVLPSATKFFPLSFLPLFFPQLDPLSINFRPTAMVSFNNAQRQLLGILRNLIRGPQVIAKNGSGETRNGNCAVTLGDIQIPVIHKQGRRGRCRGKNRRSLRDISGVRDRSVLSSEERVYAEFIFHLDA